MDFFSSKKDEEIKPAVLPGDSPTTLGLKTEPDEDMPVKSEEIESTLLDSILSKKEEKDITETEVPTVEEVPTSSRLSSLSKLSVKNTKKKRKILASSRKSLSSDNDSRQTLKKIINLEKQMRQITRKVNNIQRRMPRCSFRN